MSRRQSMSHSYSGLDSASSSDDDASHRDGYQRLSRRRSHSIRSRRIVKRRSTPAARGMGAHHSSHSSSGRSVSHRRTGSRSRSLSKNIKRRSASKKTVGHRRSHSGSKSTRSRKSNARSAAAKNRLRDSRGRFMSMRRG